MQAYNDCEGESMNFWERNQGEIYQHHQNKQSNNVNSNFNTANTQSTQGQSCQNLNQNFNVTEHIARLGNMSEEDRLSELTKTATSMKQTGAFNVQDLEKVYQTASMFMNADQLSRLRTLIDMLKK
jgi:hypothetical protein